MAKKKVLMTISPFKKPNIDHFAHQVHVTGIGAHRDKKKEERLPRKSKHKRNLKQKESE
jgi:hypothetical protein